VPGAFDPFSAPEIRQLKRLRASLQWRLGEVIEFDGLVETVPTEAYRVLAHEVPEALWSPIDPCLFLQPCDPHGERWVVNLCEGSGRMTGRFNVLLDADERRLLERHDPHPVISRDGEEVEIVDLLFTRGNTVNLHWPSRRIVLSPGESADLPPERVLRLADLQVRRRAGQLLSLHDPEGRRIVPCFLNPLDPRLLPVALRLLGIFGGQPEVDLPVPPCLRALPVNWPRQRRVVALDRAEPQGCRQVQAATVALGFGLEGSPAERIVRLDFKLLTGRRILQGDPRGSTSQPFRLDPPSGRPLIEQSMSGPGHRNNKDEKHASWNRSRGRATEGGAEVKNPPRKQIAGRQPRVVCLQEPESRARLG
jgi:hypothetical protein